MGKSSKGSVVQVIGTVVDVEFPADELPEIYSDIISDIYQGKHIHFRSWDDL